MIAKHFKLGLFNAGSLCNVRKHNEFVAALGRHKPDVIAINETWLRPGEGGRAPAVPGYRLRHVPRALGTRKGGGGVGFYFRKGFSAQRCVHPSFKDVEQMWVKTKINSLRFIIGTAYRPPWLDTDLFLNALSETIASFSNYDNIILCGDFNINLLDSVSYKSKRLIAFLLTNNLKNHIAQPTHFMGVGSSLIDIICTDAKVLNTDIDHIAELGAHALIFIELSVKIPKVKPQTIVSRSFKKIDDIKFNKDVGLINWNALSVITNVEDKLTFFNHHVLQLFDSHAPLQKHIIKESSKPWLTSNVHYMISLRNQAHKKYQHTKSDSDKDNYKTLKHLVNTSLYFEQKAYFNQNINSNLDHPKRLWKNLKQNVLPNFKTEADIPSQFADPMAMNKSFLDLPGNNEVTKANLLFFKNNSHSNSIFELSTVNETIISKLLLRTKSNAMGYDGISFDMILMTLPSTLSAITQIINSSIMTSVVPSVWKTAVVRPIPKSNDPADLKDFRPISILPYLSKILEKVVYDQVSYYLENENILPVKQSGFRKQRSTNTALHDVIDEILVAQDQGQGTILVLLDFSRAFDCINISLLLAKLRYYGFQENTIRWFQSYFSDRKQLVKIVQKDGSCICSDEIAVNRGVPQGSILGPLLFILYSADIIKSCIRHCKYHLYADDLQIYFSFHPNETDSAVAKINSDLNRISEWATDNCLVLNPVKSKYLILGSLNQIEKISINNPIVEMSGVEVGRVSEARNLGLLMDGNLRFENHVSETVRYCMYRLKVLYNVRDFLSVDLRVRLCEALVLSKVNYCITAYGPCLLARSHRQLQRVQNACARFCYRIPPRSHVTPFLNDANCLKMSLRQDLMLACLLFDTIKTQTPIYLHEKLVWAKNRDCHSVRAPRTLVLQALTHRTAAFRGSFRYQATKCWNNIPPPIRLQQSKTNFKNKLRLYLLQTQKQNT